MIASDNEGSSHGSRQTSCATLLETYWGLDQGVGIFNRIQQVVRMSYPRTVKP